MREETKKMLPGISLGKSGGAQDESRRKDGDEGKTSAKNKVKSESHVRDIRGSKRRGRGKKTFIARPDGLGDNA